MSYVKEVLKPWQSVRYVKKQGKQAIGLVLPVVRFPDGLIKFGKLILKKSGLMTMAQQERLIYAQVV